MTTMKTIVGGMLAVAALSFPAAGAENGGLVPARERAKVVTLVKSRMAPQAAETAMFVGPEACIACHRSYSTWRTSLHATMHAIVPDDSGSMQPDKGIVFDGNRNGIDDFKEGLDFNKISSAFNPYKPNAPVLGFVPGEAYPYRVTIGAITYKVGIKQGGFYQQRLMVRIPAVDGPGGLSTSIYMLPFAYSPRYREYALYNADKWWAGDGTPRIVPGMTAAQVAAIGRNWTKACIGCHVTGYRVGKTATGEWWGKAPTVGLYPPNDPHYADLNQDGTNQFLGISCESCHGPGSLHILGGGDKSKILNPASLTKQQQVWLCAQCHTRGLSVPAGLHDYPYNETADKPYQIGDDPFNYLHDEAGRWPDGKTPTKGEQQYQSHMVSAHYTNSHTTVTCSDCHNPHSGQRGLPVTRKNGIATSLANNTLCLSCHAGYGPFKELTVTQVGAPEQNRSEIAAVVGKHTFHAYTPEKTLGQSNCISCHMPRTAKRDYSYDETSHTMEAIAPEKTLTYQAKGGMPSSCAASCHGGRPLNFETAFTNDDFSKWNELSDYDTATLLKKYFGPGGIWWDTAVKGSATGRALSTDAPATAPGRATTGRPD
ncbi:MAG: hypothetical protein DIJKHBIC_00358 [Thermoanaerobaculia bacterium]|nr:hypothetical protein [Thermoanaerobaculia bacterium]